MDRDAQIVRRVNGAVDDVVITCDTFRLERMRRDALWLAVCRGDRIVSFWISCAGRRRSRRSRGRRIAVEVTDDELGCIDDTERPPASQGAGETAAPASHTDEGGGRRAGVDAQADRATASRLPAPPDAGAAAAPPEIGLGLRERLADWTDWGIAAFAVARALGVMREDVRFHIEAKHVFWSDHPVGAMLHETLQRLVAAGVLEKREEPDDQYRWNPVFRGSWETEPFVPPSVRTP
jgi:hypothetical protein